ncbi:MAG: hypothetical protein ACLFPE_09030 [Bacteroidales bacterium]
MANETAEKPRYEFRTFGQNFGAVIQKMKSLTEPVPEKFRSRRSQEVYIISSITSDYNVKIRDQKLDIKKLIGQRDGFEQWKPLAKAEFPLSQDFLAGELFPALQVEIPDLIELSYSLNSLLKMVQMHPELLKVRVKKHRFGFMVNGTICEYADVLVNGALVGTVSTESEDINKLKETVRDLEMITFENINYLRAIKRICGMDDHALANEEFPDRV